MDTEQRKFDSEVVEASAPATLPGSRSSIWLFLLVCMFGICLGTVACELVLRILNKPRSEPITAGWRYIPDPGTHHVNQLHLRGRQFVFSDTSLVVLLVGDSQVQGLGCPDDSMPENLLEHQLRTIDHRFSVFSVSAAGWGNDQEYLVLEEYFRRYRADVVILWQTFDNDVWNNVYPTNMPRDGAPKPTFWLANGRLAGPNFTMDEVIVPAPTMKLMALYRRFFPEQLHFDEEWESKYPSAYEPLSSYEGAYKCDWDSLHSTARHLDLSLENLETEKTHFSVFLTPRSPRMQYGLDLTHALLTAIDSLCESHGSRFYIFYFEPKVSPYYGIEDSTAVQKIGNKYYRASIDQFTQNREYANRGLRVFSIPLLADNWKLSATDRHLNQRANRIVMTTLADSLLRETSPLLRGWRH